MKKILIIDDESEILTLLSNYLKRHSFKVEVAFDGREGLRKVKLGNPDLVILDIAMPELSGIEVLRQIKEYNPNITVIMLTGYGSTETALESLKLGAYDHIAKPIEREKLLALIKEALKV